MMATFPTFETILIEINQAFGIKQKQTTQKHRFAYLEATLETYVKMIQELVTSIMESLNIKNIDNTASRDLQKILREMSIQYTRLYTHVYTFNVSHEVIIWHLLGYFFAPTLGRIAANWNLDGQFDKGMPRGCFWYIPNKMFAKNTNELCLPVPQVINWFFNLTGITKKEFAEAYDKQFNKDMADSIIRMLNKWENGEIPTKNSIDEYFRDDFEINFSNTFEINPKLTLEENFQLALDFMKQQNLDSQILHRELLLEELPSDTDSDDKEKAFFVKIVSERYQKPTNEVIRRRLLIARATQYGYQQLLKILFPNVSPICANPNENKLIQILRIYEVVYNLTIEAAIEVGDNDKDSFFRENEYFQNELFSSEIGTIEAMTLFTVILPENVYDNTAISELSQLFTWYFSEYNSENKLVNLFPCEEDKNTIDSLTPKVNYIEYYTNYDDDKKILQKQLSYGCSESWLKGFTNFDVVLYMIKKVTSLPDKKLLINHAKKLAKNDREKLYVIMTELDMLLNYSNFREENCIQKVNVLLQQAKENPIYLEWDAIILQFEAKHYLYKNEFEKSMDYFKLALKATNNRQFGELRAEIARDYFAILAYQNKINKNNHEYLHRIKANGGIFQLDGIDSYSLNNPIYQFNIATFESSITGAKRYFTKTLYKPYSNN